ncbi:hypothetical protein MHYP_G00057020 [Metynnis hypsauchen]
MKTSVCFERSSEYVCVLPSAVDRLPGSNMGLLSGTGPVEADASSTPKLHPLLTVPLGSSSQEKAQMWDKVWSVPSSFLPLPQCFQHFLSLRETAQPRLVQYSTDVSTDPSVLQEGTVVLGGELGGGMAEWFQVVWKRLTDGWANQVARRPWGKRGWSGPNTAELKNRASAGWAVGL